jgi:tRNA(His) 5'-end guanylyltransferase
MSSKDKTSLGNRMKEYESNNLPYRLWKQLPIYARMDGICFHNYCRDLKKPFDERLSLLMIELTMELAKEFNANCGYTQSDEISLAWNIENYESEMFCGGRVQKFNSHLAAKTSVKFNQLIPKYIAPKMNQVAYFDSRVINLPDITEATNMFLWREMDAARNSIQMAARACFSPKELFKKKTSDLHEMLHQKGINWNDYPSFCKRGTFIIRNKVLREPDLSKIPMDVRGKVAEFMQTNAVERSEFVKYDMPPLVKVCNRERVLFHGEKPVLNT